MRRMLVSAILAAGLVLGSIGFASAVVIVDVENVNTKIAADSWFTPSSVSWTHTLDYNPAVSSINSATLEVNLYDNDKDFWFFKWFNLEYGSAQTEGVAGWQYLGEIDTGNYSLNVHLPSLLNGLYDVTIKATSGDFWVKTSTLTVDYAPVPEPGTLLLCGAGIAGLALYRRKKMQN